MTKSDRVLTAKEALLEVGGITRSTLEWWMKLGVFKRPHKKGKGRRIKLKHSYEGGSVRIREQDLIDFLQKMGFR